MDRRDFNHALHVQTTCLPTLFDGIARIIEYYTIRKGSGARVLASHEAIFVEVHVVQAILGIGANHREAREIPVELDFGTLHGTRDVDIRRRIRGEGEQRGGGITQIEARLVNAVTGANHAAPIEERRRER